MIPHGDVKTSWILKSSLGRSVGIVGGPVTMLKIVGYEILEKSNSKKSPTTITLLI